MLPENLLMTDHFKRNEHTDQKQEVEICCWGRKQNNFSMEVDESIVACAQNKDDNKQNKDDNKWLWWNNGDI